jgi:hypothetical protein
MPHPESSRSRVATNHRTGSNRAAHPTATYRTNPAKSQVSRTRNSPAKNSVPKMTSPILRHSGCAIQFARARCASSRLAYRAATPRVLASCISDADIRTGAPQRLQARWRRRKSGRSSGRMGSRCGYPASVLVVDGTRTQRSCPKSGCVSRLRDDEYGGWEWVGYHWS